MKSRESVILGPEIVQETIEEIRMIREEMKASQSRQKVYHDKRRKDVEFHEGEHVFLKSCFDYRSRTCLKVKGVDIEIYWTVSYFEESGKVAYRIAFPPSLANLHDVFCVSQWGKYVSDPSHVIESDDVQVRDNLTIETMPLRIEGREVKKLRNKEIALVKAVQGRSVGENATWELESRVKEFYPELF
ncbi:putative retrotransposon gag protein [Trifolium medium]|uniref:Putative retrotransposon gag protein n=1 Tax=Trifolium medium TaxID=97028 RepID=A0A392NCR2_9FABA|nr:putative retrotransposon gag protein [Trifolium medium]